MTLTNQQIAAALCEQVYRRSGTEQQLSNSDIGVVKTEFATSLFTENDGYYYNNNSGFVGRIVEANGTVFVVFRGSDLAGTFMEDGLQAMFTTPTPPGQPTVADAYDWNDNYYLGTGTTQRTQLDDALALLELAKQNFPTSQIIVTGQSLGGGLASLVTAIHNARNPVDMVKGYAIAAAPFAAQLDVEATLIALQLIGVTRDDVLGRDGSPWTAVDISGNPTDLWSALTERAFLIETIKTNVPGILDATVDAILDRVEEIKTQWSTDGVPNLDGFRIQGEALDLIPGFFDSHILENPLRIDVGSGSAGAKHGPALHNLVLRTEGTNQSFAELLRSDGALRNAVLDQIEILAPVGEDRADPDGGPSKMAANGPNASAFFNLLWKTVGVQGEFYDYFHEIFREVLQTGAAGDGKAQNRNYPNLSIHEAAVELALGIIRTALNDTANVSDFLNNLRSGLGATSESFPFFAGSEEGQKLTDRVVLDTRAIVSDITYDPPGDAPIVKPFLDEFDRAFGITDISRALAGKIASVYSTEELDAIGHFLDRSFTLPGTGPLLNGIQTLADWKVMVAQAGSDDGTLVHDALTFDDGRYAQLEHLIIGGAGNDTIGGTRKADLLFGGDGDDTIRGNGGKDLISGGGGEDRFIATDHSNSGDSVFFLGGKEAEDLSPGSADAEVDIADYAELIDDVVFMVDVKALPGADDVIGATISFGDRKDTLLEAEKIVLGDKADTVKIEQSGTKLELQIDVGAGNNIIELKKDSDDPITVPSGSQGILRINFSTELKNGEAIDEPSLQTITLDTGDEDVDASTPILLVDGKQLVGGAAFDFDKFDRIGGELSAFLHLKGVPQFLPTENGEWGVSTTDRVQQWFSQNVTAYQQFISGISNAGGGLFGGLVTAVMGSLMMSDLVRLVQAWGDPYRQVILGTQGERYILENAVYDDGKLESADLTITMNLPDREPYEIKIAGWEQDDFGIHIDDTLKWRNGLDTGTNKNGKLDDWRDLSLETIRDKLKGLGYEAKDDADIDGPDAPGPLLRAMNAEAAATPGISRTGNDAGNALAGTDGDDVINGRGGDDDLQGGDGRDVYVFGAGDGHDAIFDNSAVGNIIRFLDGIDPSQLDKTLVAGSNGAQDLLITYGQGDTILIRFWSNLTPAQQDLWAFEGVTADISSENSADTPDISVLPESQGGTGRSVIEGTTGNDTLLGLDASEMLDGDAGDDTLDGRGGNDRLFGRAGNDVLHGGAGDDRVDAGSGNDTVEGGLGNDTIIEGDGNDTYIFARGDGQDILRVESQSGTDTDTLVFKDIGSGEIEIVRPDEAGGDEGWRTIVLKVAGTDDQITLFNPTIFLNSPDIEKFVFADGVEWSLSELLDHYYEQAVTDGDDHIIGSDSTRTLAGGKGDDVLIGWGDGETYYWERGDGNDLIKQIVHDRSDRLVFGAGVTAADLTFLRPNLESGELSYDLVIQIAGAGGGAVRIGGFFGGWDDVDTIALADGTAWTRAEITQLYLSTKSTSGNDDIVGSNLGDIINGGLGNDRLKGGDGADIYRFGQDFGQDAIVLTNEQWNRVEFLAHDLSDFTITRNGSNLVFQSIHTNDLLTLENFAALDWSLESFGFKNGTVLDTDLTARIADTTSAATNLIAGTSAGQTLAGTSGHDRILAHDGADTVSAGDGSDLLNGGAGADTLNGGEGGDAIFGGTESDQLRGDGGDDLLLGGSGGDDIEGGAGADILYGEDGNDMLAGGTGADILVGGLGNDTYRFARGDGNDVIDAGTGRSSADVESLEFNGGVTSGELNFAFSGSDLVITFDTTPTDRVTVKNFLASGNLTEIHVGSATLTLQDILDQATGVSAGNSTVVSEDGGVIYGGRGNDTLVGSIEHEVFVYNRGDGVDQINDWAGAVLLMLAQNDELVLTGGIRPEDLILTRSGDALTIYFANSTDRIDIAKQFHEWDYSGGVETIRFDDGTTWSKGDIRSRVLSAQTGVGNETLGGTPGDDLIAGTPGNDVLLGAEGNDHYVYQIGNGHDALTDNVGSDTLTFGAGILPGAVSVTRDGDDAVLHISANDSVTLTDAFSSGSNGIDTIRFHDGTVWTRATLSQELLDAATTSGSDDITGTSGADVIAGGAGNDHLTGGEGGDIYLYNLGDGVDLITEAGMAGTDVIKLGVGILPANASAYRSPADSNDLVIDFGNGDRIVLDDHFTSGAGVEFVKFATGEIWSSAQLIQQALEVAPTAGADVLVGSSLDDRFVGGKDNDTLNGGKGVDTYVFNRGDGIDTINDSGAQSGADIVEFGANITAADVDLSRSTTNPNDLVIAIRGTTDKIVVTNHFAGDGIGLIEFKDGIQWTATEITSRADNAAPHVVTALADQTATQNSTFILNLPSNLFVDANAGDQMTFSATLVDGSSLPSWLSFDGTKFHGTPGNGDVGSLSVRLTAIDKYGDRVSQDFDIDIENVNDAPIATLVPNNQTATAGTAFSYQLPAGLFHDPDNDISGASGQPTVLSATLAGGAPLPAWLTFNPTTGTFSGTPAHANNGVLDIVVTASDGTAAASTHFGIAIGGGNTVPTVGAPIQALNAIEDSTFTFVVPADAFIDITPGDRLRYAAELANGAPLPSWLELDPVTGQFTGTPDNGDVGSLQIRITATDIVGASAMTTISLVVGNTNDAPTTEQDLSNFITSEGSQFSYVIPGGVFADEDAGDTLSLSAALSDGSPLPAWLVFNPVARTFSGTPDDGDVGIIAVRLTAMDGSGASTDAIMYLVIGATNDAPTIADGVPAFGADQYEGFEFTIPGGSFADVDSSGLNYSARMVNGDPLPSWMTFDPITATFTGSPNYQSVGEFEGERIYQIEITATDSDGASVSQMVEFAVRGPHPGMIIEGTAGDDVLMGARGPDQFHGGAGNDTLVGGDGIDTYLFGRGDGQDLIERAGDGQDNADDVIRFGTNVLPSNVTVSREGSVLYSSDGLNIITAYSQTDLKLTINGTSDSITVENQFGSAGDDNDYFVGSVRFENGTAWTAADLAARFMQFTSGNDFVQGDFRNNVLSGGAGNDRLLGLDGNDTLDGGTGNDDLYGGYGDDAYLFGIGSGDDRIIDFEGGRIYSSDTLRFGPGITLADLIFTRDNRNPNDIFAPEDAGSLLIEIAGTNDSIRIFHQYSVRNGASAGIDRFEFADGSFITRQQLDALIVSDPVLQGTNGNDSLNGTSIDERLIGGEGDDNLYGGEGDDTYVWNLGDGDDRISENDIWSIDILEFGAGIDKEDIRFLRDVWESYIIEIIPTGEKITVSFGASIDTTWRFENPIDEIQFADGTSWTSGEIRSFFVTGTPGNDLLIGFDPHDDFLDGGAGNDRLEGRGGADTYVFGRGYGTDTIYDRGSRFIFYDESQDFDVIRFQPDVALEDLRFSSVLAEDDRGYLIPSLAISIVGTSDKLVLVGAGEFIERLYFESTGTEMSASVLRDLYYAQNLTSGNDTVIGFGGDTVNASAGNDTLTARHGDTLIGGTGNDTYVYNSSTAYDQTIFDDGSSSDIDLLILDDTFDEYGKFERAANGRDLYVYSFSSSTWPDIVLQDFFVGAASTIDRVRFANGVEWNRSQIIANSVIAQTASIIGTSSADTIDGDTGVAETITGGLGADTLSGGISGGDIYVWKKGDGNDTIIDQIDGAHADLLKLTDVNSTDVSLLRNGDNLVVRINSTGEFLTIEGHFHVSSYDGEFDTGIGQILFADAVLWRRAQIDANAFFEGTASADTIIGSTGVDLMVGHGGNDTYTVDHVNDVVVEAANGGTDTVGASVSYTLATNLENLNLAGTSAINGTGNGANNVLTGNSAANTLSGLAGNDTLDGLGGGDTLIGGSGDDLYIVDSSTDSVVENADEGTDTVQAWLSHSLAANVENATLLGTSSAALTGNALVNTLTGNNGNNMLAGLQGADTIDGGSGTDTASYAASASGVTVSLSTGVNTGGDAQGDILLNIENITGSGFNDVIEGSAGTNTLNGGLGTDLLSYEAAADGVTINIGSTSAQATGGAGTDTVLGFEDVRGSNFNDTISGNTGANVLTGGTGIDTLLGKAGSDRYIHRNGDGNDIINDDSNSTVDIDVLDLSHISSADVLLSRVGIDMTVRINSTGEVITVRNQFNSTTANWGIERIEFSDTAWDLATVNSKAWYRGTSAGETIGGAATSDTLDGGDGNDTITGGVGDDTYIYSTGYANDVVNEQATGTDVDTLNLVGLNLSDVRIERLTSDLTDVVMRVISSGATISLDNQFDLEGGVERIQFADGTVLGGPDWSLDTLLRTQAAFYGTSGDDTITAGTGVDVIRGLSGNDTLNGGTGADILEGGAGNDTYIVDDSNDLVVEFDGEGMDTVQSSGNFALGAHVENLTLTGSSTINGTGNSLANIIVGNTGNNVLAGLGGADTINGGNGTDTVTYAASDAAVTVNLLAVTASGGDAAGDIISNIENLIGSQFDDILTGNTAVNVLSGLGGNDTLEGGDGNDTLDGGEGADVLRGGIGNDTYTVDDAGDGVVENLNGGTDLVQASISYALGDNVENLTLLGSLALNGTGNVLGNTLIGNTAMNELSGGDGNDILQGLAGDDSLQGGIGNDALDGGIGADSMSGGVGNDNYVVDDLGDVLFENLNEGTDSVSSSITLTLAANIENLTLTGSGLINGTGSDLANTIAGNTGNNILSGLDGNDTLNGGNGNDVLLGGAGNDVLNGGSGADQMGGGAGNDSYTIDDPGDQVVELLNEGIDGVSSSIAYTLLDNFENLTLTGSGAISGTGNDLDNAVVGNSGNNALTGQAGNDTLTGANGDDTLWGGDGDDVLDGGSGSDIARYKGLLSDFTFTRNFDGTVTVMNAASGRDLLTGVEIIRLYTPDGQSYADYDINVITPAPINGTSGNDNLTGTAGNDTLNGGGGNDTLNGGGGDDALKGGAGNDTYIVDSNGDIIIENANEGTDMVQSSVSFTLSANVENLTLTGSSAADATGNAGANILAGNSAANTLTGGDGADTLNGGSGDDTLDGGLGNDTMLGGLGDDTYVVDSTGDTITEASNEGADTVQAAFTYTIAGIANVENLTLTGTSVADATGNAGANVLTGNSAANTLTGGDGADTLYGGGGNDTIDGGDGDDRLVGGDGNDFLQGGAGIDFFDTDAGDDEIDGGEGAEDGIAYWGLLSDFAFTRNADLSVTVVSTAYGADTLRGVERFWLYDTEGHSMTYNLEDLAPVLPPNLPTVTVMGTSASETLTGTWDDDVFHGKGGDDLLEGSAGSDIYIYSSGDGSDVIDDHAGFTDNTDVLLLTDLNASDLSLVRNGIHLFINVVSTGSTITVSNQFSSQDEYWGIDRIDFANGSSWDRSDIALAAPDNGLPTVTVFGTEAAETLTGTWDDDVLHGKEGDDVLEGSAGSDTYIYSSDDGSDIIDDHAGFTNNTDILLLTDLNAADLTLSRNGIHLLINVISTGEIITVLNQFSSEDEHWGTDRIEFANGSSWDRNDIALAAPDSGLPTVTVLGTSVSETLTGTWDDDVFHGKEGDDVLEGSAGSDTYIYSSDDGNDIVNDHAGFTNNTDILLFTDLNVSDINLARNGIHLLVNMISTGETITVLDQFSSEDEHWGIDRIDFANGTSWDREDIAAAAPDTGLPTITILGTDDSETLTGTWDDDVFHGKNGNDLLLGSAGSDTYVYGLGDGSDYIDDEAGFTDNTDVLLFADLDTSDVSLSQDGVHLLINILGTGETITIDEQFADAVEYWGIERIDFANGTSMDRADILDAVAD